MQWNHSTSTNRQYAARALSKFGKTAYCEVVGRQGAHWEIHNSILVTRARPWVPWSGRAYLPTRKIRSSLANRWVDQVTTYLGGRPDLLLTYDPMSLGLARLFEPLNLVYDCVDIYEAQPWYSGTASKLSLRIAEKRLAHAADLVTGTSPGVVQYLRRHGVEATYLSGAVLPPPWGNEPLPDRTPRRRFVYVGALDTYKLDFRVLHKIADIPHSELVVVGKRENLAAGAEEISGLQKRTNVRMLGPLSREDLWPVLRDADVGVIALAEGEYSDGSFPLKVWDYLWACLPVIAVSATSLVGLHADVHVTSDVNTDILEEILAKEKKDIARRQFAAAWTSDTRLQRIVDLTRNPNEDN
ncbi:glycosyltransferase [Frankia torreyi]|nr:glycosyltransferase [Frankia torreyi]